MSRNNIKVTYFAGQITRSETFIFHLVKGLSEFVDVNVIVVKEPFYELGCKWNIVNDGVKDKLAYYANYLFGIRGKKFIFNRRRKKMSNGCLSYFERSDVVFIEYGTNAVQLIPALAKANKPFVVHFHGFDITTQLSSHFYKKELKLLFKKGSLFIAASHHIKRLLVINGCPEDKIKVVRLGVSIPNNLPKLSLKEKSIDFIFIGRLTQKKSPIALIRAFYITLTEVSGLNLHIVGEGPLMKECKELVNELKIEDSVVFHGGLDHLDAMAILNRSKVYVQHSVTPTSGDQEGFAISLAEAGKMKIPVISTLHNGIPENVIADKTGFLVREYDYETMGTKMIELITNHSLINEMGNNAHDHINQLCKPEKRVEQIIDLLKSLVA